MSDHETQTATDRVQAVINELYPLMREQWLLWVNQERNKLEQDPLDGTDVPPVPVATVHAGLKNKYRTYLSNPADVPQQSAIALPSQLAERGSDKEVAQVVSMALGDLFADREAASALSAGNTPSESLQAELKARLNESGGGIPQWRRSGPSPYGLIAIGQNPDLIGNHAKSVAISLAMATLSSQPKLAASYRKLEQFQKNNPDLQETETRLARFLRETSFGRFIDRKAGWLLRPTVFRPFLTPESPTREEIFASVLEKERPSTEPASAMRTRPSPEPSGTERESPAGDKLLTPAERNQLVTTSTGPPALVTTGRPASPRDIGLSR
jgi:hypothetical protein